MNVNMSKCNLLEDVKNPLKQEFLSLAISLNKTAMIKLVNNTIGQKVAEGAMKRFQKQDLIEVIQETVDDLTSSSDYIENKQSQRAVRALTDFLGNINNYIVRPLAKVVPTAIVKEKQESQFIPYLSPKLNERAVAQLHRDLFNVLYYSPEVGASPARIVLSVADLNKQIASYKNRLFAKLAVRFNPNLGSIKIYDDNGSPMDYGHYQSVMIAANNELTKNLLPGHKIVDSSTTNLENQVDPLIALHILNNFDLILNQFAKDKIDIKQSAFGDVSTSADKYTYKNHSASSKSWTDEFGNSNADKQVSKIFKEFVQNIQIPGTNNFISSPDMNKMFQYISNSLELNHGIDWMGEFSKESATWKDILDKNLSREDKVTLTLNLLKHDHQLRAAVGDNIINSVQKALEQYNKVYLSTLNDPKRTVDQRKFLEKNMNFASAFIQESINHINLQTMHVDVEKGMQVSGIGLIQKSKKKIRAGIVTAVLSNIKNKKMYLYKPTYIYDGTNAVGESYDIFSSSFVNHLLTSYNLNMSQDMLNHIFNTPKAVNTLMTFLKRLDYEFSSLPENLSESAAIMEVDKIMDLMVRSAEYVAFTAILVETNENNNIKIFDLNGNLLPNFSIPNVFSNYRMNLDGLAGSPAGANNIFVKFGELSTSYEEGGNYLQHATYRGTYKFGKNRTAVKGQNMSAEETQFTAFNHEFFQNIVTNGVFANQAVDFSDKVKIGLTNINMVNPISYNDNKIPLLELTTEQLKHMHFQQFSTYYAELSNKLVQDYSRLFKIDFNTLEEAISHLQTFTAEEFYKLPIERGLEIMKEMHYSTTKGTSTKPSRVFFNKSLYYFIKLGENEVAFNEWHGAQEDNWYKDAISTGRGDLKLDAAILNSEYFKSNIGVIHSLLDKKYKDLSPGKILEALKDFNAKGSAASPDAIAIHKSLSSKYFALQALTTDAELQLSLKYPIMHGAKGAKPMIDTATGNFIVDTDILTDVSVLSEIDERYVVSSKRNNAGSATYLPFQPNKKYGVRGSMKIAIVESMTDYLVNFNGNINSNQAVHDGAVYSNGIHHYWENASFDQKNFKGTKKSIGFAIRPFGLTQMKCADFPITNELIRNSSLNSTSSKYNMKKLFKAMNDVELQIDENIDIEELTFNRDLYVEQEGEDGIRKHFKFLALTTENGGTVAAFEAVEGGEYKTVAFNTAYELWEALGGEHSLELNEDGYSPSDISMEFTADIISEFSPDTKTEVIAKIADQESIKSSQINVNTKSDVQAIQNGTGEFKFFEADTRYFGIQMDASHQADESLIPGLTQVFTALAFNGNNVELVGQVYDAMAAITEQSLAPLQLKFADKNEKYQFHLYLAKELIKSLQSAKDVSSAPEIAAKTLEDIIKWEKERPEGVPCPTLPYSSPEIFSKVSADFLSRLNHSSLRSKFAGIPIVLNPSQGIVTIFEDNAGKTYTQTDLYNMGKTQFTGNHAEVVSQVLATDQFANKAMTPSNIFELTLGDRVNVKGPDGDKAIQINNPKQLYAVLKSFENGLTVEKVFKNGRDLKTETVIYTQEIVNQKGERVYVTKSFWAHDAVKLRLQAEENPNTPKDVLAMHMQYYKAVLKGLGDKNQPYNYPTIEDWKNNRKQNIISARKISGEQILPKVNKSAQGLGNATLAEIRDKGAGFFIPKLKYKFQGSSFSPAVRKVDKFNVRFLHENDFVQLVQNESEIIITNADYSEDIDARVATVQEIDGVQWLVDENFEQICINPSSEVSGILIKNDVGDNGKRRIIISTQNNNNIKQAVQSVEDVNASYFAYNENPTSNWNFDSLNFIKNQNSAEFKVLSNLTDLVTTYDADFDAALAVIAGEVYQSFLFSNRTTSARIPSQSLQSFMANETVAFTESDGNDGYVNIWEIWFQGSDFDIDKAYTMMYGLDKLGRIRMPGKVSDFSNAQTIDDSLNLPLPNTDATILVTEADITEAGYQRLYVDDDNASPVDLINAVNKEAKAGMKYYYVQTGSFVPTLITRANKYNNGKANPQGLQNQIANAVYNISMDVQNLEHAQQPMSSDPIRAAVEKFLGSAEKTKYGIYNPKFRFSLQEDNSIGKVGVGIAANGVKVGGTLQQYFNTYFTTTTDFKPTDPENVDIELNFDIQDPKLIGKTDAAGNPVNATIEIRKHIRHFGDIKVTRSQLTSLYPGKSVSELDALYVQMMSADNVADTLSMMISLAVDNAKELLLSQIYAGPEMMSMHIALIQMGFTIDEMVQIATTLFKPIQQGLKNNRFGKGSPVSIESSIKKLGDKAGQAENARSLKKVYQVAQELTLMAKFFKINQGVAASYNEVLEFRDSLSNSTIELYGMSQPLDVNKFITNEIIPQTQAEINAGIPAEGYRDRVIREANLMKTGINIFDVIAKSPHFFSMLTSLNSTIGMFAKVSLQAALIDSNNQGKNEDFIIEHVESYDFRDGESNSNAPTKNDANKSRRLQNSMYHHYIVGEALKKLTKYRFTVGDLKQAFPNLEFPHKPDTYSFDLSTSQGVNAFMQVVEQGIIPDLKASDLSSNAFVQNLISKFNYGLDFNTYDIDVDQFGEDSLEERNRRVNITEDFKDVINKDSKIKNIFGKDIKLGEIFYLYNLIAHKNKLGGMTPIIKDVDRYFDIKAVVENEYTIHDRMAADYDRTNPEGVVNKILEDIKLRLRAKQNSTLTAERELNDGTSLAVDLTGAYVYTLTPAVVVTSDSVESYVSNLEDRLKKLGYSDLEFTVQC